MDTVTVEVLREYTFYPVLAFLLSLPILPWIAERLPKAVRGFLRPVLVVAVFACSVLFLVGDSYNPFIYFRF